MDFNTFVPTRHNEVLIVQGKLAFQEFIIQKHYLQNTSYMQYCSSSIKAGLEI